MYVSISVCVEIFVLVYTVSDVSVTLRQNIPSHQRIHPCGCGKWIFEQHIASSPLAISALSWVGCIIPVIPDLFI